MVYERFTDRARKVMQLANVEAQRFGHAYIGIEHILIGLCRESSGVFSTVVSNRMGVSLPALREAVTKLLVPEPNTVVMGKLPQTPAAKKVIEGAIATARGMHHNYVGTEHLFVGVLQASKDAALGETLVRSGLTEEKVVKEIESLLGIKAEIPSTSSESQVIEWKILMPTAQGTHTVIIPAKLKFEQTAIEENGEVVGQHIKGSVELKESQFKKWLEEENIFRVPFGFRRVFSSYTTKSPTNLVFEFRDERISYYPTAHFIDDKERG